MAAFDHTLLKWREENMSQRAEIDGNGNRIVQLIGHDNVVEDSGPHLSLNLQIEVQTNAADNGILYSFYPRARSTTFIGREAALDTLNTFLDSSLPVSFMVLTGEGGSGKTRLALEICRGRRDKQWNAGFVSTRSLQSFIERCITFEGWECGQNTLVVLDYAGSLAKPLHDWLEWLTSARPAGSRMRILLLERTADQNTGWLREVIGWGGERSYHIGGLQDPASPYELGPLASREDCLALVQEVLDHHGYTDATWRSEAFFLQQLMEATMGGLPLFLMMAAYNIHSAVRPPALTREMLALEFAKREEERIRNRANANHLHETFLLELVACVTLAQGMDRERITLWIRKELAREYMSSGCAGDYIDLLCELLPCAPEGDGERLFPLRPDPIGEIYIWHVLRKKEQYVLDCLKEFGVPALETLLRLAHDFGGVHTEPLHWLDAALESKEAPEELEELAALMPSPSLPLRAFHLATATKRLKIWKEGSKAKEKNADIQEYAFLLNDYAIRLHEMGQYVPALEAAQEVVGLYRKLSVGNPTAFRRNLAMSLNNLANRLHYVGQREPALKAAQEAADIYRELSAGNPAAFRPSLAMSLTNLAAMLHYVGQHEPALKAAQEAVGLYRKLSAGNPTVFRPYLAGSLNNLSNRLSDVGQREPARKAAQEAADIYRELSVSSPAAFGPDLAMSLNNLSNRLSDVGQREPALKAAQEAAGIYRELSASNPAAFRPDLASSLNNLGNRLRDAGQRKLALKAAQEAVSIRRELSASNPAAFRPGLAKSLNNIGKMLRDVGQREPALEAAQEAADIYRDFSVTYPDFFFPYLEIALQTLLLCLQAMNRNDEAAAVKTELQQLKSIKS